MLLIYTTLVQNINSTPILCIARKKLLSEFLINLINFCTIKIESRRFKVQKYIYQQFQSSLINTFLLRKKKDFKLHVLTNNIPLLSPETKNSSLNKLLQRQ